MQRNISGSVTIDNDIIGDISGQYIDNYQDGSQEDIEHRVIPINIVIDNTNIGNGTLEYDDYITYNSGGQRNISISGNVTVNDNYGIGSITGSLIDQYGKVLSKQVETKTTSYQGISVLPIVILILLIILSSRRR